MTHLLVAFSSSADAPRNHHGSQSAASNVCHYIMERAVIANGGAGLHVCRLDVNYTEQACGQHKEVTLLQCAYSAAVFRLTAKIEAVIKCHTGCGNFCFLNGLRDRKET
jgi:hypothetical protein